MVRSRLFKCAKISFLVLLVCCSPEEEMQIKEKEVETIYQYTPPIDLHDGLTISNLSAEGLNDVPIRTMMDSINSGIYATFNSLLIFKNDKLIFEEYFNGFDASKLQPLWSVTKSISSAIIGISLEQGKISNVNETIHDLMARHTQVNWSEEHKQITLKHYLTMSSGYHWVEMESYQQLINSDDWIKFVLELPLTTSPGTKYKYNTGSSTLFSVIVADAVNEDFVSFTANSLLSKIEIDQYDWGYMPGGYAGAAGNNGGLYLTARDMSKFGLLYLNRGNWKGEQVISESWVDASISPQIGIVNNDKLEFNYGYQWWRNERVATKDGEISVPYAVGHGGQYLFLIEDYDMLIVATSPYNNPGRKTIDIFSMIEDYILSAIRQ